MKDREQTPAEFVAGVAAEATEAAQPSSRYEGTDEHGRVVHLPAVFTAGDLDGITFAPTTWVVAGLIPSSGYGSLAGRPKGGKSFLALQLVLCYAAGGKFLGLPTSANGLGGKVLYMALEDGPARLQKRIRRLAAGLGIDRATHWRKNLVVTVEAHNGKQDEERLSGLAWLEELVVAHRPGLVVIDTKARLLPRIGRDGYAADYAEGSALQEFAFKHRVAMLALTHTKKRQDDESDHLDASQGTTGETAAQDVVMTLSHPRGTHQGRLRATGRDLAEDLDLTLEYDPEKGPWESLGATPAKLSDIERAAAWLAHFLKAGPKVGDDCVRLGNAAMGLTRSMDWWRKSILKEQLGGKPQQSRPPEGASDKARVWLWSCPQNGSDGSDGDSQNRESPSEIGVYSEPDQVGDKEPPSDPSDRLKRKKPTKQGFLEQSQTDFQTEADHDLIRLKRSETAQNVSDGQTDQTEAVCNRLRSESEVAGEEEVFPL